ncbi:18812_t:CDS:2, partial [Gigaspora rosea]
EIKVWKAKTKSETKKELVIAIIEMSLCVGMIIIKPNGIIDLIETVKKVSGLIKVIEIDNMALCDVYSIIQITKKLNEIEKLEIEFECKGSEINYSETNMAIESEIIESLNTDLLAKILETDDQKGILMNAEWKTIKRQMEQLLEFPINQNIKGAKEYLNSLTNFFTFIDAYIKAKIDVIECKRECSRIRLQVETFKMKEARLKKLIKISDTNQIDYNKIVLLLFERLINIKCWIMIYMENYLGAYEYWSLSRSKLNLSVIKTFSEHRKDIETINNELESSYHRFQDKPQHFRNRSIIINEEKYIEEFKRNRCITIEIFQDHSELSMIDRALLSAFRVFLNGVESIDNEISLSISNNGLYSNRSKGKNYHFRSIIRKSKVFMYKPCGTITTDHTFDGDEIFFQPTPFSQWRIRLNNDKLDLSNLESIEIKMDIEGYYRDVHN